MKIFKDNDVVTISLPNCSLCARVLAPSGVSVESRALESLSSFLPAPGLSHLLATPDIHPSDPIPVGTILASPTTVYPIAIGKDINCGMRLIHFDISLTEWQEHEKSILSLLKESLCDARRNIPVETAAWAALAEEGPEAFYHSLQSHEGLWRDFPDDLISQAMLVSPYQQSLRGASKYYPEWMSQSSRLTREPGFGTLGSGNHFFEFQILDQVYDRQAAWNFNIKSNGIYAMIHTGSRDIGSHIGARFMDLAKSLHPSTQPRPPLYPISTPSLIDEYLLAIGAASHYAWMNRTVLSEMARQSLSAALNRSVTITAIADVPHNIIMKEGDLFIHRKGATPAHNNKIVLIPGSMGDYSYIGLGASSAQWLNSCSHGAGRSHSRGAIANNKNQKSKLDFKIITNSAFRSHEEAPAAYKNVDPVINSQVDHGLITKIARSRPLVTFKA